MGIVWYDLNKIRHLWNKCDIVEEPNSSSKHGERVTFFSLIMRNVVF